MKELAYSNNIPFSVIPMNEKHREEFDFQLELKSWRNNHITCFLRWIKKWYQVLNNLKLFWNLIPKINSYRYIYYQMEENWLFSQKTFQLTSKRSTHEF